MSSDQMGVIAAIMSTIAAIAALSVAWLSLLQARTASEAVRRRSAHEMDSSLQARLDPLYPGLRDVLGHLEDGVPREVRAVLIPFFVLFSDAFAAHRDGLLDDRDWLGGLEYAYWAQKPTARRAWLAFRDQTWTAGFAEHVDAMLAGPSAYPELRELVDSAPEFPWPEDTTASSRSSQ